jgi:hypothetical protein
LLRLDEQIDLSIDWLVGFAIKHKAIRVGATIEPEVRRAYYESHDYEGTMYVVKTTNMNADENKLLDKAKGIYNVVGRSSKGEEGGHVYAIVGTGKPIKE